MFDGNTKAFETKPEVFSLEGLIAWLETQDPATTYNYLSNTDCVLCRYFIAAGIGASHMTPWTFVDGNGRERILPDDFHAVPHGDSRHEAKTARSYRGVLERARQLLSSQSR